MHIGILGAGSWAIALSVLLKNRGHVVRMWEFNKADAEMLAVKREHPLKLPGIIIPDEVVITNEIGGAIIGADYVCALSLRRPCAVRLNSWPGQPTAPQFHGRGLDHRIEGDRMRDP